MSKFLFGESKEYPNPYVWGDNPASFPVSQVCERLMGDLEWGEKTVRKKLVEDLKSKVSYLIHEVVEKHTNSFTLDDNGGMISCLVLAKKQLAEYTALLQERFPRIKWKTRIQTVVDYRSKWDKISDNLQKDLWKLQEKLRKEHGCPTIAWQDRSKMTKEQKVAYDKACDENYKQYTSKVLEDPKHKTIDAKRRKASNKLWHSPKTIDGTISLMAECLADIFFADNKGSHFSVVELHDDTDLGSAMEHGDLFDKLPHKQFSHH
jgi:hypothetical protein